MMPLDGCNTNYKPKKCCKKHWTFLYQIGIFFTLLLEVLGVIDSITILTGKSIIYVDLILNS